MTRIIAHMVIRNEADRFLDSCLEWNKQWFDELHVYDGNSTDRTLEIARTHTSLIGVHPEDGVGFYEDEGKYRTVAWRNLEKVCAPEEGDWVFCLDADEFLIGSDKVEQQNPRSGLELLAEMAEKSNKKSAMMGRAEIWDASGVPLKVRVDGEWARDRVVRFVRWEPKGKMRNAKLGCGSVPDYGLKQPFSTVHACRILHFGYAIEGEAERKYSLYSGASGNAHSGPHIASIVMKPKLVDWDSVTPKWWLGER